MQFTKSETSLIKQRLSSPKLLLYIVAALTLAMDAFFVAFLVSSGMRTSTWWMLLLLAVLDLVPFPAIWNSNFRFKYSRVLPVIYIVLSTVFMLLGAMLGLGVFTNTALIFFAGVHLLASLALVLTMLDATKLGKWMRLLSFVIVLLLLAAIIVYALFSMLYGFYGQGTGDFRVLKYAADTVNGGYKVVATVEGSSDKVVIPATFNGKPVTAIDCALFEDESISSVRLECGANVDFVGNYLTRSGEVDIYIDKAEINALRQNVLNDAKGNKSLVALSNRFLPDNLSDGEVFISFNYSDDTLAYINYTPMNTWFGQVGEVFRLSEHASGAFYAAGFDLDDEAFLKQSFENGMKALLPPEHDGKKVDGTAITESIQHLTISFDDVFAIKLEEDNDLYYETAADIKSFEDSGFRYVLASDRNNLLGEVPLREGFELLFQYEESGERKPIASLAEYLAAWKDSDVREHTLYPVWTLKAPTITEIDTSDSDDSIIYGESITLLGSAVPPVEGLDLEYAWYNAAGELLSTVNSSSHPMQNMLPSQSGVYVLRVTARSNSMTSLTSESYGEVGLTVGKREINMDWTLPSNTVYSGTDKSIGYAFETEDLILDDVLTSDLYEINHTEVRNAGSYTLTATLLGRLAELYYIPSADNNVSLEITPYALTVNWESGSWIYNAIENGPIATSKGVGDEVNTDIALVITGRGINAGTHTATATVNGNANYTVQNNTMSYEIAKRPITLVWSNETTLTYSAQMQNIPVVSFVDLASDNHQTELLAKLSYTGAAKDVGSYTMSVSLDDANYELAPAAQTTCDYVINKKVLTLNWPDVTTLTYNGYGQRLEPAFTGVLGSDEVTLVYSAASTNKNFGSYTSTVTGVSNSNYALPGNTEQAYNIAKKLLSVAWSAENLVYNGEVQHHTATLNGIVADENVPFTYQNIATNIKAGQHTVSITITDTNYELSSDATHSYEISKRELILTWGNKQFTYNKQEQSPTVTFGNVVANETVIPLYFHGVSHANVGSYTVSAGMENDNYVLPSNVSCSYEILPREVTVTWGTTTSFIYDKTTKTVKASITDGVVDGDIVELTYAPASLQTVVGDDYTSTITGVTNTNYVVKSNLTCGFVILPAEITVTWPSNTQLTYNGKSQRFEAEITGGVISGDTVTLTYSAASTNKNVGNNYTSTITGLSNENYVLKVNKTSSYEIVQAEITLTWPTTSTMPYNGHEQGLRPTVGGVFGSDVVNLTYATGSFNTNAGSYTTVVESLSNSNYKLPSNISHAYSITKVVLTLTWPTNPNMVYNATAQYPKATVSGAVAGETLTLTYTPASLSNVNVGDYTVTVSAVSSQNYELPGNVALDYSITPETLSVSWSNTSLTYTGKAQRPTATLRGMKGNDQVTPVYSDTSANIAAGNHNVTVSIENSNYKLSGTTTYYYDIAPVMLTLTWSATALPYNGEAQRPTATPSGMVNGESVTLNYSATATHINVGSYEVTVSIEDGNYTLPANKTHRYQITALTVTIAWDSTTSFVYNASEHAMRAKITAGVLAGENVELIYSAQSSATNVNTYTATVTRLSSNNYKLPTNVTCTYSITPAPLTVSWDKTSFVYNAKAQRPTATLSGLQGSDQVSPIYTNTASNIAVDDYRVTVSINNANYTLTGNNLTCEYSITPATLTATWGNTTFTYNGKAQQPTASFNGLQGSDQVSPIYTNTASNKAVGDYSVTVSINNANYTLTGDNLTCAYKITPAPLTVTWDKNSFIYNATAQRPTASFSGLQGGDLVAPAYTNTASNKVVGDYSVTVSINNANYTLTGDNLTYAYKITPATLTVTWDKDSFTYNATAQRPTASFSGLQGGDLVAPVYTNTASNIAVGDHSVTVSIENDNYILSGETAHQYSITPATLTVSWDKNTFTYNAEAQRPNATLTGMQGSDQVTPAYTDTASNIAVGNYSVTVSIENDNYTLSGETTYQYSITPATLTVSWDKNTFVYNAEAQYPNATLAGMKGSDLVTPNYSNTSTTDVGDYDITVSIGNANYVLSGELTYRYSITPATLTLTFSAQNEIVADGTPKTFEATVSGEIVPGAANVQYTYFDATTGQKLSGAPTAAGSYKVVATVENDNYAIVGTSEALFSLLPATTGEEV